MIYAIFLLYALMIIFGFRRLYFSMKFMQQNNNFNGRFFGFAYLERNLIDTHVFIPFLTAGILATFIPGPWLFIPIAALSVQIVLEKNPTKGGIKPLNVTSRAKRIIGAAVALWIMALIPSQFLPQPLLYLAILIPLAPMFLMLANIVLIPVEKYIQYGYLSEAKAKLRKFNPTVIGITGSFGKTSLKNILHHILGSYSTSFATKRSINTLMGIVRVIREEMNAQPKYFVAEIGVADTGQMAEMTRFLRPNYGIITAVGAAHLENFKTIEKVAREKFRLSQYVAKNGGRNILSAENIAPEFIEKYKTPNDIIFTGKEITNIKQTIDGLSFALDYDGKKYELDAPVYGMHQAQNIALAFIMARMLGVPADGIALALKTLKQTEHRLEVKREGDMVAIDDAFNSNIKGFLSALETGAAIKGKGRFILITPGMVELGKAHAEQHRTAGAAANKLADLVIAVNPDRINDFTDEISNDKLKVAKNLTEARAILAAYAKPGDTVLYENDLPDVYIEKIRI